MRKVKQAAGIVLSLMLFFGLLPPVKVLASGNVTISVSSSAVNVGETVTVTAWASGPNGEAAIAKLGFNYDSGKFSFVSCSESEYSGGSDGYVGVTGSNVSITLKATASGTASVTVSGSGGVNASDGTVEYGELSAGGTKLTINEGALGTTDSQQNNPSDNGDNNGTDNANKSGDNSLSSLSISPGTLSPSFQYSETNYTASVAEDVTSVTVDARPSNEKAVVESITGQTDLQPGQNTISIVVKAENGAAVTYKIVVTRGGASQETPEGNQEEAPQENPEGITINGHSFNLAEAVPDEVVPQDFTKTAMACQGQQVEGLQFDKAPLVLVYLTTPSTEVKNTLAVYDEASGSFYPFRKVEIGEKYIILLNPPTEAGLPAGYTQASAALEGFEDVPIFVSGETADLQGAAPAEESGSEGTAPEPEEGSNSEGTAPEPEEGPNSGGTAAAPEFSLVYGVSSTGNMGWYQYDAGDGFFQRYVQAAVQETPQEADSIDSAAELQGLQNSYKDLEEQLKEKKSSSRRTIAVMVFVIAVLLVVIVNLILRGRQEDDDEEEDIFVDAPKPKVSRRARKEKENGDGMAAEEERKKRSSKHAQEEESEPKKHGRKHVQEEESEPKKHGRKHVQEAEQKERQTDLNKLSQDTRAMGKPEPPKRQETPAVPKVSGKPEQKDDFEVIDLEDL